MTSVSDQLVEWLTDVKTLAEEHSSEKATSLVKPPKFPTSPQRKSTAKYRGNLFGPEVSENTALLLNFVQEKFMNEMEFEPVIGLLHEIYHFGEDFSIFVLQAVPTLIETYLHAKAGRHRRHCGLVETFLLSIYSQQIMDTTAGEPRKKITQMKIPSLSGPSVYHHPVHITQSVLAETTLNRLTAPSSSGFSYATQLGSDPECTNSRGERNVQIGPYPTVIEINAENRFLVLSLLMKTVNSHLAEMHPTLVIDSVCHLATSVCRSGFHFPESDLPTTILGEQAMRYRKSSRSNSMLNTPRDYFHTMDQYSPLPRVPLRSDFMLELSNCVYYALFNGGAVEALRAVDDIRQRASFELFADVLLATNAVVNSLLENPSGTPQEGPMGIRVAPSQLHFGRQRSQSIQLEDSGVAASSGRVQRKLITNASLRVKKLPEDIPVKVSEEDRPASPTGVKKFVQPFVEVAEKTAAELKKRTGDKTDTPPNSSRKDKDKHNNPSGIPGLDSPVQAHKKDTAEESSQKKKTFRKLRAPKFNKKKEAPVPEENEDEAIELAEISTEIVNSNTRLEVHGSVPLRFPARSNSDKERRKEHSASSPSPPRPADDHHVREHDVYPVMKSVSGGERRHSSLKDVNHSDDRVPLFNGASDLKDKNEHYELTPSSSLGGYATPREPTPEFFDMPPEGGDLTPLGLPPTPVVPLEDELQRTRGGEKQPLLAYEGEVSAKSRAVAAATEDFRHADSTDSLSD